LGHAPINCACSGFSGAQILKGYLTRFEITEKYKMTPRKMIDG
jgi:hypothetical protein